MIETIVWATKIGEPDWKEDIISNNPDKVDQAIEWAKANGFDRIRVAKIDMTQPIDFTKAINI